MKLPLAIFTTLALTFASLANADEALLTPSPEGAETYIITPEDGAVVSGPVLVRFGLRNIGVAPAGVEWENTGHHHLLINHPIPPAGEPMPNKDDLLHFGGGQTETTLELEPGTYTLQLILGDQFHVPHNPPVISEPITITVE